MATKSNKEGLQAAIRAYIIEEVTNRVYRSVGPIMDMVILDVKAKYAIEEDLEINIPIQVIVREYDGKEQG